MNLLLNKFLRFSILIGPLLMLAIRLGIFHSVTYSLCIVVSLLVLALCCVHYVMIQRGGNTVRAAVIAFLAMDSLLILMNSAHIGIYITWFVVPLISLLFCDFKTYTIAVVLNYCMMTLSVWIVSPYYANLRVDFDRPFQYFMERMGGFSIETAIMVVAGYALCRISTGYYRELIEKYRILNDNKRQMKEQLAVLESMAEIYQSASLIDLDAGTEISIREAQDEAPSSTAIVDNQSRISRELTPTVAPEHRAAFAAFANLAEAAAALQDPKSMDREFRSEASGWLRAQYIVVERRDDGTPKQLIYTIQNIDKQKQKEEQLIRISMTDELTRLHNRRRYDADIEACGGKALAEAINPIGRVYRTGGDEFLAIVGTDDPEQVVAGVKRISAAWSGKYARELSLSVGYAAHADHPDADIHGLEILADQMMYREKKRYYSAPGVDRRRLAAD